MKAYMTVEAALIMPVVIGIQFWLLFVMSYCYDRCLLEQDTFLLTLRASTAQVSNIEDMIEIGKDEASKIYEEKYVFLSRDPPLLQIQYNKITVSRNAAITISMPKMFSFSAEQNRWEIQTKYTSDRLNPIMLIRLMKKMKTTLSQNESN